MAQYAMQEAVDLNNEGQTLVFPKLIIDQCVDSDQLARQIAAHTTFSYGEIVAVIDDLVASMSRHMADGRSVKIKGMGLLTPTLAYKKGVEREQADGETGKRNATSFMIGGVNFRPEKSLLTNINQQCDLHRSKRKFTRRVSPFTEEERLAKALAHIEENGLMTLAEYVVLSGLSRTSASRELKKWSHDSATGIQSKGRSPHTVYVKCDNA